MRPLPQPCQQTSMPPKCYQIPCSSNPLFTFQGYLCITKIQCSSEGCCSCLSLVHCNKKKKLRRPYLYPQVVPNAADLVDGVQSFLHQTNLFLRISYSFFIHHLQFTLPGENVISVSVNHTNMQNLYYVISPSHYRKFIILLYFFLFQRIKILLWTINMKLFKLSIY